MLLAAVRSGLLLLAFRSKPSPVRVPAATSIAESTDLESVASNLIHLIEPTDRGIAVDADQRAKITSMIEELERSWECTDAFAPAQQDLLLRRTEVVYVGQSDSAKANAAGGKYRGRVGRLLFRTETLFQHVLPGDTAVNVIHFRLFGCIPGTAVLRGRWARASDTDLETLRRGGERVLSANTVRVDFEAPRVAFGREGAWLNLQFGPSSKVGLDTTYLDERLRCALAAPDGEPFLKP